MVDRQERRRHREYFNRIVANPAFAHLHDKAGQFVEWLAGKQARDFAHKVEAGVKNLLAPSVIFEDLGLRYYGPIDGHDIPLLIRTFEFLKTQNEPVILHILTKKGKGYAPALEKPDKFHGLGKFHLETGETVASATPTYSELLRQDARRVRRSQQQDRRHHRRHAQRHGARPFLKAPSERYFRRRHRRGTCRALRLRPRRARDEALPRHLLHLHAARLRHDHP